MLSGMAIDEEFEVTVGDVRYVLIPNQCNLILSGSFKGDDPTPLLVYLTAPGEIISKSTLCKFRADLDQDDIFQPSFCCNIVFYGSEKDDLQIEPDALEELAAWQTKTETFVTANSAVKVAPGPYVFAKEKTWQPWRIYRDFNAIVMTSLKPLPDGVKDNIDIAGHKTTLCNRAWIDLYPAKTKNAACIQVLLDAGAVVVCKVKLQAMIMREEPLECVEFTAPFNPRADGYQVPSGSSHGSAAGIGSYDWLDFSIGSDTQTRLIDKFVEGLESALHVTRTEISLAECWKKDCPDGPEHTDIAEYLRLAGGYPYYRDSYDDLAGFRDEYAKKHGKPPFVQKAMRWQWDIGKTISVEQRDMYWRHSEIYRLWLLDRVFKADSKDSRTIMVFPIEVGKPNYRESEPPPFSILSGYASLNMAPMMRAPELTAPGDSTLLDPLKLTYTSC
ncbi:MAG: hypothetical protein Q9186_001292 [Xanthomendoza sp. 1 TL-2023]